MDYLYNIEFEKLEKEVEVTLDSMRMFIQQEDYDDFFETFGEIFKTLSDKFDYAVTNKTEDIDRLYDLMYNILIPDSVDLMKETWIMTA